MGCNESLHIDDAEFGYDSEQHETNPADLLDHFSLGQVIGRGRTAVVYAATDCEQHDEYAVKIIDSARMPDHRAKREAEMLLTLKHPRITNCHGVFYDASSVCVVTDVYRGGDLIAGMQRHRMKKGGLGVGTVQRITQMLLEAAEWLHQHAIVHRDLKGDNYFLDCEELEHPHCQVVLGDFGTAKALPPGQRLAQQVGTVHYWAPELFGQDYGLAVDVWALGVVVFGLVWGKFPFKNEDEIKTTCLRCPSEITAEGESFLQGILAKDESARLTSARALEHRFLSA